MWDEIAAIALIDPSIIAGQKQLYMDIDTDHGAGHGKTIFWELPRPSRPTCAWQPSSSTSTRRSFTRFTLT